jgi:hypothetical protein
MMARGKPFFLVIGTILVLLLVSACGGSGNSTSNSSSSNSNSQSALQVLQKSANAMKSLKSSHFTMNLTDMVSSSANGTGTSTASSTPSTSSTPTTSSPNGQSTTISLKGSGDESSPNKVSDHVTVNQALSLSEIIIGKQVYIQNQKGQWYSLNLNSSGTTNPLAGSNVTNYNSLLDAAQHAKITDHGMQTLNGHSYRYITVTFDKSALVDLLNATGQTKNLTAQQQQNLNNILKNITLKNASMKVWIEPTTYYVHQMQLQFMVNVNTKGLATPNASNTPTASSTPAVPSSVSSNLNTTIDYSKFNQPVTITAPSNATPATNISSIFGY